MLNINWQKTSLAHITSKFIYNKLLANALLCAELKSVLTVLIFVYWKKVSQVGAPVVEVSIQ